MRWAIELGATLAEFQPQDDVRVLFDVGRPPVLPLRGGRVRSRADVLAYRIHAQQLDRPSSSRRGLTNAAIFDIGVQDTGRDGASWALVNRGVPGRRCREVGDE